jgi:hypothetical protein
MGTLLEISRNVHIPLRGRSLIGRSADASVPLVPDWSSREHAILAWSGDAWEIRDVGSHNGTFVNGEPIAAGTRMTLAEGAELGFGRRESTHRLVDASPPQPLAIATDGSIVAGSGGLVELAGEGDLVGMVMRANGDRWALEVDGRLKSVRDGEEVAFGGRTWRLVLPSSVAATITRLEREVTVRLVFRVSRDEEHVEITAHEAGRAVDIPARSHHYLLLTLARLRMQDAAEADIPRGEQGWVDSARLEKLLRKDEKYINVLVHRARKQFADAGLASAARLVERRDLARQLRLGIADVSVVGLG